MLPLRFEDVVLEVKFKNRLLKIACDFIDNKNWKGRSEGGKERH